MTVTVTHHIVAITHVIVALTNYIVNNSHVMETKKATKNKQNQKHGLAFARIPQRRARLN